MTTEKTIAMLLALLLMALLMLLLLLAVAGVTDTAIVATADA